LPLVWVNQLNTQSVTSHRSHYLELIVKVKNIGKTEGYIRLSLAVIIIVIVFLQPTFGLQESFGVIAAFCLCYNFFYSHCYGWQWIGISTYRNAKSCPVDES
tara:strand:+ start:12874 stop:13179 length:306 start_codon:yes stop_codon:yes gene_type:complete